MTTVAPRRAKAIAVALPIPLEAPVIMATLPRRDGEAAEEDMLSGRDGVLLTGVEAWWFGGDEIESAEVGRLG
jgi:hypothetical protein